MSNPYFWDFPQRNDTMYMSTIENKSGSWHRSGRQSSFLKRDIQGAYPKQQIPETVTRQNFNNSTIIEPRPENYKKLNKVSNPLRTDDIEHAKPQAVQFRTNRINNPTNPLVPRYKLPSFPDIDLAPPNKFLRNTLDISDMKQKKSAPKFIQSPKNEKIAGSQPAKLFKTIQAVPRLSVKDINDDGKFVSARRNNPTDPLNPSYAWKDKTSDKLGLSFTKPTMQQQPRVLNQRYGEVEGSKPQRLISEHRRSLDYSLQPKDIEGTAANSTNQMRLFISKRKQFRDYMKTNDIDKTHASSLKKGITTSRNLNPLMPKYDYPQ